MSRLILVVYAAAFVIATCLGIYKLLGGLLGTS